MIISFKTRSRSLSTISSQSTAMIYSPLDDCVPNSRANKAPLLAV